MMASVTIIIIIIINININIIIRARRNKLSTGTQRTYCGATVAGQGLG